MGNTSLTTTPCESCGARVLRAPQLLHGVRRLRGRPGRPSPDGAAFVIFNAEDAFVHPSEFHGPEVYVPEPIVDFFQSDGLARQRMRDANPVLLPSDAAVATDEADFEVAGGARDTYERIRENASLDPAANLALANIYERQYKVRKAPELLASSDQAIKRVVDNKTAAQKDRVEALALRGRNAKTRWREQFASITDLSRRRIAAMTEQLRQSYGGYADAFREDLNHFWSGLAVLQMGVIFTDLTKDDGWSASFDDDTDAGNYRQTIDAEVAALKVVVGSSIDAGLRRLPTNDPNRVWANISKADLRFLTDDAAARVVNRYLNSIPPNDPFAWDAARGQLELFESLGVRAALARQVIDAVNASMEAPGPPSSARPRHVVMFAGHQFDQPGRSPTRFPTVLEQPACRAILEFLLQETDDVIGLASGSVGADILFHEACSELKVLSKMCLPIASRISVGTRGGVNSGTDAVAARHSCGSQVGDSFGYSATRFEKSTSVRY